MTFITDKLHLLGCDVVYRTFNIILYGTGLWLGYKYYKLRQEFDLENAKKERIRGRLKYILDELGKVDEYVNTILSSSKKEEVIEAKAKLSRAFELINVFLEKNEDLLKLSGEELESIAMVNSFIENSYVIFPIKEENLTPEKRHEEMLSYIPIIQEARTVCLQKAENV